MILVWVDDAYGLISWKMDLEIGHNVDTRLRQPRLRRLRREFRRKGLPHLAADQLLPTLRKHSQTTRSRHRLPCRLLRNLRLIASLGELDESLS